MRQLTELETDRIKLLTENSVEVTLIEPTETGLEKSIMDATGPVRTFLKTKAVHDFEGQKQGPEHKIQVPSYLVETDKLVSSVASLYRPVTKKGDPRIWFKGLGNYSNPNDILAIIVFEDKLYVVNISRLSLKEILKSKEPNPFKELVTTINQLSNSVADELLKKLIRAIGKGPVPAMLHADTAIGRTLENILGININSSKKPDYKGIELKSYRDKKGNGNRKNLFAQVPNWELSKFKSSAQILDNFGYSGEDDFRLYCTVSSIVIIKKALTKPVSA